MSNIKPEHKEILNLIERYLSQEGGQHIRFTQALFNLSITEFKDNNPENEALKDNYNDSDEKVLKKIKKCLVIK